MKQILFVDDEPNFLNGLRRMLRAEQDVWSLHFAYSAQEGLEKTKETAFDVIVCDMRMPVMDGLDFLQALQSQDETKNIPAIMLTGNSDIDLKRRALDMGAADLLNKPVNSEDLRARLRNTLRLKEYQDAILNQNVILEQKVRERTLDLEESQRDIVFHLAKAGEFRDEETGSHVMRVAWCSHHLAQQLGLNECEAEQLFLTSPLHDIGKIGIPDGILLKPGTLDEHERAIMRNHCAIGAAILSEKPKGLPSRLYPQDGTRDAREANRLLFLAAEIALGHHEKWDGTGYPNGKRAEEIPVTAQIVSIADVYDALRSARTYKPAISVESSVEILETMRNENFSDMLVQAFLDGLTAVEQIRERYAE